LGEIAELLSNASLREQMKSTTNAEQLHQLIDSWQSSAHSSTTVHA
jgi:PTS system nitrogen regulatory IIA component